MTSTARVTGADTLSSYLGLVDGELVDLAAPGSTPAPLARLVHDSLGAVIDSPGFTCLGAKAARHQGFYRMGVFGALGDAESTAALAAALERFVAERAEWDAEYSTMIASFTGPVGLDEEAFETALWDQLSALHRLDRAPWDPRVSSEPDSPEFSFSFAGEGFFVVGLHGGASRWTRRFAWPTLVFNPHEQFEAMRGSGGMELMQRRIRERDVNLQGSTNPNLSDYGSAPESRQYSGRRVDEQWRCPFRP